MICPLNPRQPSSSSNTLSSPAFMCPGVYAGAIRFGHVPLGELVRSIVGLDHKAANDAFSQFLSDTMLDSRQMYFVRQIVNYIVKNGMMKDLSVLQESPFTDQGSISELFDNMTVFMDLRAVINEINGNAMVA